MNQQKNNKKISTMAAGLTSLYLAMVVSAAVIMFISAENTAMSGIFLVLVTLPWSFVLTWAENVFHLNFMGFDGLFLLAGGLVNSVVLYKLTLFMAGRFSADSHRH